MLESIVMSAIFGAGIGSIITALWLWLDYWWKSPMSRHNWNKRLVTPLLLLSFLPLTALAKDPFPSDVPPFNAGIVANYWTPTQIPAYNATTFNLLQDARFSLVRFLPDWQLIEKTSGVYDFTYTDWMYGQFAKRQMRPIIGLGLNNPMYGVYTRIDTEAQRVAFGNYVRALVRRYAGKRVIWELWNEPNISHFWRLRPGETLTYKQAADEYLALLAYIAPIVREEDPNALFIGPSAANYNTPWMQYALAKGMLSKFDALSVHPYNARPEPVIAQHEMVKGWIPVADRGKPVLFTEWGFSTGIGTGEVTPEVQANYDARQYLLSLMLGVKGSMTYGLADQGKTNPCTNKGLCYGLFGRYSGTPKPAFYALRDLQLNLAGFRFVERIPGPLPTTYLLSFRNYLGQIRYAMWDSQTPAPYPVKLPCGQVFYASQSPVIVDGGGLHKDAGP